VINLGITSSVHLPSREARQKTGESDRGSVGQNEAVVPDWDWCPTRASIGGVSPGALRSAEQQAVL